MDSSTHETFRTAVEQQLLSFKKGQAITEEQLDQFTESLMADRSFDADGHIYCRHGFAFVNKLESGVFQIAAFQINAFGKGIFSDSITRFVTPILLKARFHNKHQIMRSDVRDALLSIDEYYLGQHYCGSKGPLCMRDKFNDFCQKLFKTLDNSPSTVHQLLYSLINANYLCHHIAETTAYAIAVLHKYYLRNEDRCFMSSGSSLDEAGKLLQIDIISDFSGMQVANLFKIPNYEKITDKDSEFAEEYNVMEWEITIDEQTEKFLLPSGYQKAQLRKYSSGVNVVTTQHMIDFILQDYFKLINVFIITNTYQTLEYLSRAMVARREKHMDAFLAYMKTATFCMGYFPERDLDGVLNKKTEQFPEFRKEFFYSTFFRPPVLK